MSVSDSDDVYDSEVLIEINGEYYKKKTQAKKTNLTLIGRAKGKRYTVLSGAIRLKH